MGAWDAESAGQAAEDVCAVLWISGQDALDMEAASDEEVSICSGTLESRGPGRLLTLHALAVLSSRAPCWLAGRNGMTRHGAAYLASRMFVCEESWQEGCGSVLPEQVRQGINAILDAFPALDLPRSFSVTRSRWHADPLCRGSYSFVTPGTSGDDIEALAAPLVRTTTHISACPSLSFSPSPGACLPLAARCTFACMHALSC